MKKTSQLPAFSLAFIMSTEFEVGHSIAALMSQLSGVLKGLPNGITQASLTVLELGILRRHCGRSIVAFKATPTTVLLLLYIILILIILFSSLSWL